MKRCKRCKRNRGKVKDVKDVKDGKDVKDVKYRCPLLVSKAEVRSLRSLGEKDEKCCATRPYIPS